MSWKENPLFKDLSEEEFSIIQNFVHEKTFEKDATVIKEGERGSEVYFIESGKVSILKNDWIPTQSYQINLLSAGEVFGEMAVIGTNLRSASVRALEPLKVQQLSFADLSQSQPQIASKISKNLNALLASRLSETNSTIVTSLKKEIIHTKKRAAMSNLVIKTVIMLVLFQVIIQNTLLFFKVQSIFLLIAPLMIAFSWLSYGIIRDSGYPLKMYGITTRNWKRSIQESILFSLPFLLIIVLLKYLFILYSPEYAHAPLFDPSITVPINPTASVSPGIAISESILYILFVPAQEFIFRGALQSSLQRFLLGRRRILSAILVTNLIFMQTHFHFNLGFLTFFPGVFWSWLFLRHRTLVGVSVSHLLIGVWMTNIVGLRP